ncbi:hypothetical protein [Oscillatoria acuminata]|uniref:Uncharacterized protein n=1 Tax=Oscillatoria acuminata PCC 6304 TaxID=56110 RepID=K9TKB8_9CYAN|nr:hypothetical protein [Oscillatoria acuminata]AFY82838.1 hypothetical protein Oscil6304_3263 [Oscillatoria acuminata PCC 6304]
MLIEFRSRYPTASLISELLTVHQGLYVVRTLVQMDGVTLATGMAAEPTIEQAEDRARVRAIAVLGTSVSVSEATPSRNLSESAVTTPASAPAFNTLHLGQGKTRARPTSTPMSSPGFPESQLATPPETAPAFPEVEKSSPSPDQWLSGGGYSPSPSTQSEFAPQSLPETSGFPDSPTRTDADPFSEYKSPDEPKSGLPTEYGVPSSNSPASAETHPTATQSGSVDLSDAIAQTTIEIKRLGWTNDQGRNHLKQTYGVPSRSLLSEDQLLDFLTYLKNQPSPS